MCPARTRPAPAESLLPSLPIFKDVDAATIRRLAAGATRRALARGEVLFRRGDMPTGMYVVVYGAIRLVSPGARGDRLTGVVRAGSTLGEPVMFLGRPAVVDAVAGEDSLVLHLARDGVLAEVRRNPEFAVHLLGTLSARIESLVQELERHAAGSGRERLARYLLREARREAPHAFVLPATKAAVAAQLLLTPEHFSRLLHEFAAEGLVTVSGRRVEVADPVRLAQASQPKAARARARARS